MMAPEKQVSQIVSRSSDADSLGTALKDREARQRVEARCGGDTVGRSAGVSRPRPGYVLKTRNGREKVFVNVCSDASAEETNADVPHATSGPRRDVDKAGRACEVYDVVFHPGVLSRAAGDASLAARVNDAALDAVERAGCFSADRTRVAFPKMKFKGHPRRTSVSVPGARTPRHALSYRLDAEDPTRPSAIVVDIFLPEMTSAKTVELDVEEKKLTLTSTIPERYHLQLDLPYPVDKEEGVARFDKNTKKLIIHLPVKPKSTARHLSSDSGVDVDVDEEQDVPDLFKEDDAYRTLNNKSVCQVGGGDLQPEKEAKENQLRQLQFPSYTCNIYDELMVLKLDVKNVEEDSMKKGLINSDEGCGFSLRFSTKGSDMTTTDFGFDMIFLFNNNNDEACTVEDLEVEIWDNSVIVQMGLPISDCMSYKVGNSPANMKEHSLPQLKAFKRKRKEFMLQKTKQMSEDKELPVPDPRVVSPSDPDKERHSSGDSAISVDDGEPYPVKGSTEPDLRQTPSTPNSICGILKWPAQAHRGRRCFSESDQLTMMMSMASISSCQSANSSIPEEQYEGCGNSGGSIKKSVRFSEVVQRQVFRTNSSILGRRMKNLKKSEQKKRKSLERRRSEGDSQNVEPMMVQSRSWTSLHTDQNCNEDSGMASSAEDFTLVSQQKSDLKSSNSAKKGATSGNGKINGFSKEANLDLIFHLDF